MYGRACDTMKWLTLNSSAILCRGRSRPVTCALRVDGLRLGSVTGTQGVMLPWSSLHGREINPGSEVLDARAAVHISYQKSAP